MVCLVNCHYLKLLAYRFSGIPLKQKQNYEDKIKHDESPGEKQHPRLPDYKAEVVDEMAQTVEDVPPRRTRRCF